MEVKLRKSETSDSRYQFSVELKATNNEEMQFLEGLHNAFSTESRAVSFNPRVYVIKERGIIGFNAVAEAYEEYRKSSGVFIMKGQVQK